ncbi:SufE family protein [bacterium]|nr:SufE family protein [bacterium]MDC1257046.1 SufE family protein [bacterium]
MNTKINNWAEELEFLDDDSRLVHLIDLAKIPTTLPEVLKTDYNKIDGCMSQIWVGVQCKDNQVTVQYDSDAMITKGITHIICDCFDDIPLQEAKAIQATDLEVLGIKELLTAQRRNGLGSLIQTIIDKVNKL